MVTIESLQNATNNVLAFADSNRAQLADVAKLADIVNIVKPTATVADLVKTGLIDFIKVPLKPFFPTLPTFPTVPTTPTTPSTGGLTSSHQGMLNSINSLNDVVNGIKKELENPNLSPEKRQELAFKLQEAMQNRSLMSDLLSTMMKDEFNIASKILRNLGQ